MGFELFAALDADWRMLITSGAASAALRRWADDPVLRGLRGLDEVLERTARGADREDANAVLAALARRAPSDDVATRVLLQALTPGLTNVARRMGAARDADIAAEVLTVALAKIRCYPCERRPRAIAANLVLDVLHQVWQTRQAASGVTEAPVEPENLLRMAAPDSSGASGGPNARDVLELVAGSGRLPSEQLRLVSECVLDRVSVSAAAARAGISTKAMMRRRERARASVVRAYHLAASA